MKGLNIITALWLIVTVAVFFIDNTSVGYYFSLGAVTFFTGIKLIIKHLKP